jgi:hypothetical protein
VARRRFPERETPRRAAQLGARWIVARFGGDAVFRLALPPSP